MSCDALTSRNAAELSDAIGQLHALGGAVLHALLEAVRAYDRTGAWRDDGAGSMAAWVSYALGVTATTASDYVRVARALGYLPAISAALREGRLCYEQVRALVRVATAHNEAELVEQAAGLTATQVEAMVRGLRAVATQEAAETIRRRSLRLRWDQGDRMLRVSGRFPDVDGVAVATAIERIADRCIAQFDDPDAEPWDSRCADALVELASLHLAADAEAGRTQVVVHVEAEALAAGEDGTATLECGVAVAPETVRRLACDAHLRGVVQGAGNRPLGVGRRSRTVPASLLRLLRHRDGGCRFPGCTRTRWIHAHHVRHWADGGPTDLDNLVTMCSAHHRFVHEGGWRIEGHPGGDLRFVHPDGHRLRVGPAGLRPEVGWRFDAAPWLPPWIGSTVPGPPGDPAGVARSSRAVRGLQPAAGAVAGSGTVREEISWGASADST